MNDVNFLPAKYGQHSTRRRTQVWGALVLVLFAALTVSALIGQYTIRRGVESELAEASIQYATLTVQQQQLATIEARLLPAQATAELLVYLRHPWPMSRILQQALSPLPEAIMLSRIEVSHEQVVTDTAPQRSSTKTAEEAEALAARPIAARALEKLRRENQSQQCVVRLHGTTSDIVALHSYLSQLAAQPLFAKAQLTRVEQRNQSNTDQSEFTLQLVTASGYGSDSPNVSRGPEPQTAQLEPLP